MRGKSRKEKCTRKTLCANENLFVTEIYVFEPNRISQRIISSTFFSLSPRRHFWSGRLVGDGDGLGIPAFDVIAAAAVAATATSPVRYSLFY